MVICKHCGKKVSFLNIYNTELNGEEIEVCKDCFDKIEKKEKEREEKPKQEIKQSKSVVEQRPKLTYQDIKIKQELQKELKKKQIERETELRISNKNLTKEDNNRLQKIKQLESELNFKLGTGSKLFIGGSAMSLVGIFMMIIGGILSLTVIGAIIGIPLLIIGFIIIIGSGLLSFLGIGTGVTKGIINEIKKKGGKNEK